MKKCIDIFACYKLNRFHWHLTDDQGWRIEIKQYPRLMALSEVQWCSPSTRDINRLKKSIAERQIPMLKLCGYNYRGKGL